MRLQSQVKIVFQGRQRKYTSNHSYKIDGFIIFMENKTCDHKNHALIFDLDSIQLKLL